MSDRGCATWLLSRYDLRIPPDIEDSLAESSAHELP